MRKGRASRKGKSRNARAERGAARGAERREETAGGRE